MLRAASPKALLKRFSASPQSATAIIAIALTSIVVLSALAFFALRPQPLAPQVIYGSGRIEADEVRIGVEVAGRLLEVNAVEGAALEAGALVARIEASDYELQRARAAAEQRAAAETVSQLGRQISLADHHAGTARSDLARYETLSERGFVTAQRLDMARNAYRQANDEAAALRDQRGRARAQEAAAAAMAELARSQIGKTQVRAPRAGMVLERLAEPGEVVAPGQPVAIIANLSRVRLRVFIGERDLGRVRPGAEARIRVDAFPDRFFDARVAQIDAQAQFTPRDVHTEDERSRTVYGVTLEAANPETLLKPGMPADAWILWDGEAGWPQRLIVPE
jgi:HlyD family secretion protein